jgi:hypothetical protein
VKLPRWLRYWGDAVIVPIALMLLFLTFVWSTNAGGVAQVVAALFMFAVVGLWLGFRRLRVHASASRLAAIGDPAGLLALADEELGRRLRSTSPAGLQVYRAIAHNLAGRPAEARLALDASGIRPGDRGTASWHLLWASAEIDARTRLGEVAAARATFDRVVARYPRTVGAGGLDVIAAECEARVRLAEGDAAGARTLVAPYLKDIRLGPGARAQLFAIVAGCERALGDDAAAATAAAKARELAPQCVLLP